jgi:periplasmic protein TonB
MKKGMLLSVLLLNMMALSAQDTKQFKLSSIFFKTYSPAAMKYVRKVQQVDSLLQYEDYDKAGKLVQAGFYTDTNFTTPAGRTVFYQRGKKLYEGDYLNGKPAGYWYFFDAAGNVNDSVCYAYKDTKKVAALKDTLAIEKAAALKNEHLKKDSSAPASKLEKSPAFPGGMEAWKNHLLKYIHVPELVLESSPYSKGTVQIQFVVCNDGEVCSIQAMNSVHPLVDLVAVKAIRKGPRWEPALQNGKSVKAYQRQPITFILDGF